VVPPAYFFADVRKRKRCHFSGEIHRDLSGKNNIFIFFV
jgi:hypothetical protein